MWTWLHKLGSPPRFYRLTGQLLPWFAGLAAVCILAGLYGGLWLAPPDYQQGDSFRIIYVHAPAAWMSMFVYVVMAACSAVALIWRIKVAEMMASASAPIGASFTFLALVTGSLWGKPMWGTWWDWDPRLTTQLILFFMYLGVIGLYHAIDDRRAAARVAALLAIVGVALVPVIRYSVVWWDNTLHQGQTVSVFGESKLHASMLPPLVWMVIGTKFWFAGSLLARARADNLYREAGKEWVRKLATEKQRSGSA